MCNIIDNVSNRNKNNLCSLLISNVMMNWHCYLIIAIVIIIIIAIVILIIIIFTMIIIIITIIIIIKLTMLICTSSQGKHR